MDVISADKVVIPLDAGVPFTPTNSGWFVPDARFKAIMDTLKRERIREQGK